VSSAISDTCVAMKEWVDNPHAETALSSILPCVDQQTTNQTLSQSKVVINSIVTVVNTFVYAVANTNPAPGQDRYYNQSGPPMPPLCIPFDANMEDRQCSPWELSIENASSVLSYSPIFVYLEQNTTRSETCLTKLLFSGLGELQMRGYTIWNLHHRGESNARYLWTVGSSCE